MKYIVVIGLMILNISTHGMDSSDSYTTPTKNGVPQKNILQTPDENAFLDDSIISSVNTKTFKQSNHSSPSSRAVTPPTLHKSPRSLIDSPYSLYSLSDGTDTPEPPAGFNFDKKTENGNKTQDAAIITALENNQNGFPASPSHASESPFPERKALGKSPRAIVTPPLAATVIAVQKTQSPNLNETTSLINGHKSDSDHKGSLKYTQLEDLQDSKWCCHLL